MDIQRLKEIFDKTGPFAIIVGQNYGVDEMASALSLYLTLKSLNKDISIVSSKQPLVEVSSLVGINNVKSSYEGAGGDMIVSFPYQQDEIGKVSYTLENGLLNIIVKPKDAPLSFGEKDVIFKRSGGNPEVIITIGVERISELQSFFDVQNLKDTVIVNIDKQGNNEGFGDVVLIGQNSSSVSEQIAEIMLSLNFPIEADLSQNLMSGIIAATGNFQSPRTSSLAFEMAGILLRSGAKREPIRVQNPAQVRTPQQFGYNMKNSQNSPRPQSPNFGASKPKPQSVNNGSNQALTQNENYGSNQDQIQQIRQQLQAKPQINTMSQDSQQPVQPAQRMSSMSESPKEQRIDDAPLDSSIDTSPDAPPDWLTPKIYKGSTNLE